MNLIFAATQDFPDPRGAAEAEGGPGGARLGPEVRVYQNQIASVQLVLFIIIISLYLLTHSVMSRFPYQLFTSAV